MTSGARTARTRPSADSSAPGGGVTTGESRGEGGGGVVRDARGRAAGGGGEEAGVGAGGGAASGGGMAVVGAMTIREMLVSASLDRPWTAPWTASLLV
jgi:hypothetical protein